MDLPLTVPLDAPPPKERLEAAEAALQRAREVGEEYETVEVETDWFARAAWAPGSSTRRGGENVEVIVMGGEPPTRVRGGAILGGIGGIAPAGGGRGDRVRAQEGALQGAAHRSAGGLGTDMRSFSSETGWSGRRRRPQVVRSPQAANRSIGPEVLHHLGIASVVGSEDEQFEAIRPCLERPGHLRRDPDRVHGPISTTSSSSFTRPAAREDDGDLLRLLMAMGERLALARANDVIGQAGGLGAELLARKTRLLRFGEAVLDGHVLDLAQVLDLVVAHGTHR